MKTLLTVLAMSLAALSSGCAQMKPSVAEDQSGNAALFESLKKLEGRWDGPDADKDGKPDATTVFKLTAGGSAVEETLFPGAPHEMVDLYVMDQGKLVLTHYCLLGNQPRMAAGKESTPQKLVFHLVDGMNLDPARDRHMGALTLTIVDPDHIKQEWVSFAEGKPGETRVHEYTRKN